MTNNLIGQRLGQYEVIALTGAGGMSNVYRAHQASVGRDVAIKVISAQLGAQTGFSQRFEREARIVARLEHPHILSVYDYGQQDNLVYLVMRLMPGGTLSDLIARGALSLEQCYHILSQIGDALDYAHRNGVVHRDIKPSNVLFDGTGNAYLSDFGIARIVNEANISLTQSGTAVGTPAYMSPEAGMGASLDGRSDLYSLGVVAFEMLTGKLPFSGETPITMMIKQVQELPPSIRSLRPELPETIDTVISKALAKKPEDRYQTAAEMIVAFGAAISDSGIDLNVARFSGRSTLPPAAPDYLATSIESPRSPTMYPPAPSAVLQPSAPSQRPSGLLWIAGGVVLLIIVGVLLLMNAQSASPGLGRDAADLLKLIGVLGGIMVAGGLLITTVYFIRRGRFIKPTSVAAPPSAVTTQPTDKPSISSARPAPLQPNPVERTIIENVVPSAPTIPEPAPTLNPVREDATSFFSAIPESTFPDVQITVMQSDDQMLVGKTFKIDHTPFTIGRLNTDLNIKDKGISRHHTTIDYQDGTFYAKDESSSNGTYLNGKVITDRVPLMFGNTLQLGSSTKLTFVYGKPTTLPDLTGEQITARYRLDELLKTSGKTVVYRAYDTTLEIDVAVKVLSPELASFSGYAAQFDREAKTASKLQHPHIVKIKDFGTAQLPATGKISYIVMELLTGGTLTEHLQKTDSKPTLEQVASWVEKIADALDYAHRHGVIHSGLKPSSIVFNSDDIPFVTDFAIAAKADDSDNHMIVGAPAFLAPEQWDNVSITSAVDQFALAALTYLMVTGMRPYESQENPEIRRSNFALGPRPAHQIAAHAGIKEVPASVSEVIAKGLATDPNERYASTVEFSRAFKEALTRKRSRTAQPRIFISYQRDSSAGWAVLFSRELREKHNILAFVDTERLDSAMQFPLRLKRAIEECDVFVCLLAEPTLRSKWVQEEIRLAHEYQKPMVPVMQESYALPAADEPLEPHIEALTMYDGVQLLDRKNIFVDETIAKLARIIMATVNEQSRR